MINKVRVVDFFDPSGCKRSGRLVTSGAGLEVVHSRNPYGAHNLVLVDEESREVRRFGTLATTCGAAAWMPEKAYRRVRRFLANRGIGTDWTVYRD